MRRRTRQLTIAVTLFGVAACMDETPTPTELTPSYSAAASDPTPETISLTRIGGFEGGGLAAAEITAYDHVSKRLFVVNGALGTVDVLDLVDPSSPTKIATLSVLQFGSSANSVAADNGVVAVAVQANPKTNPGTVAFYRATTLQLITSVTVGALPDMLTFTPDGRYVLVANEGEPSDDYTVDPVGSISIISVSNINRPTVQTAAFGSFHASTLRAQGVRIFGLNQPTAAQDLEPEYVAVSDDGRTAYATLQENNALAIIDVASATVTQIVPLGFKNHAVAGRGLDPSDRDGGANIATWPVWGMYQPDGIAAYTVGGRTYLVTANEGDAREYPEDDGSAFAEEARVNSLTLHPDLLTACGTGCATSARLGRLTVTSTLGRNSNGVFEALFAFGARSFSIWNDVGQQIFDSGDELERRTRDHASNLFNADNEDPAVADNRSDNKGPEPEDVVLVKLGQKTFAFVGLERVGGVIVYDVTDPYDPSFVTYVNTRTSHGDLGPEGLAFVPAKRAPGKQPLLIVGNEISGTTAVFRIDLH